MAGPIIAIDVPATSQFHFIFGRYSLTDSWSVPYLLVSMTLREAAESLRLVSEFPGQENLEWKIDELYQRDIDWVRVRNQILPYLRAVDRPHFFNSLTVALLPVKENKIRNDLLGGDWQPPGLVRTQQFQMTMDVGPMSLGYYANWQTPDEPGAQLGQLRWNPNQVFGVAIDGQHRLAAIKELYRNHRNDNRVDRTRVPVILLLLTQKLGYVAGNGEHEIVPVLRRLFIDLNKHAKVVHRSRQILLDDTDPNSLCVRSLVEDRLSHGRNSLDRDPPTLPLTLVDWHSEQAKFDDGPYITTILGLDWIVEKCLGAKPVAGAAEYARIRRNLNNISRSLGLHLNASGSHTLERLKECENGGRLFHFTGGVDPEGRLTDELGKIVGAFRQVWAPGIVHLLSDFSPYADLIAHRDAIDTINPEFARWYHLYLQMENEGAVGRATEEYRHFVDALMAREPHPLTEQMLKERLQSISKIKADNLAFLVVFQRALALAMLEFVAIDQLAADFGDDDYEEEEADEPTDGDNEEEDGRQEGFDEEQALIADRAQHVRARTQQYVESLNCAVDAMPQFLERDCAIETEDEERRLWAGNILSPAQVIDFSLGASDRAKELIFWAAVLFHLSLTNSEALLEDFADFWESIFESDELILKRLVRSVKRYSKEGGSASRILAAAEEEYDAELAMQEARIRLQWMWLSAVDR